MAKYKIGIVGFGKIAQDQHVPAIRGNPNFELVALSSQRGLTHDDAKHTYTTHQEMLEKTPELDAVAICTPPGPRHDIARDCLAAGKAVLLEKPPAGTTAELVDLELLARQAGKTVFTTWHAQYNAGVERAREALAGKAVKSLTVTWKEDVRRWHPAQDWVFTAGGMGVFDPGINALSIVTRIMPTPVFIKSAELEFPAGRDAPIAARLELATGRGEGEALRAEFDWRQTGPQTWDIAIETVEGSSVKLSNGGGKLEVDGAVLVDAASQEYPGIYKRFAELLDAGQSQIDAEPFRLVADAFMIGKRTQVEAFSF